MTASALGGQAGRVVVGPLFERWGIAAMFGAIAGSFTVGAVQFVLATLRGDTPASAAVHDLAV